MQKKFLSNLALIVLLNLLIKPLAIFGIDATVQNQVGTAAYGLYFSLINLSYLFNIVLDLGINNYTTKHIAQFPHVASRYINKILIVRLLLFVLYALITLIAGIGIGYKGQSLNILVLLIFNQCLITLIAYFRSHFGGLHLFKTDALISVMDRLLLIVTCGSILYLNHTATFISIEWFVWMQTICYGLTLITSFFVLTRVIGFPKFNFNWTFSLVILKKSYPYALLVLLMMIYTRIDSVLLERIHPNGAYESGIYAQGYRLLDAFFMFGMLFANLLLPIFSRMLKTNHSAINALVITARNLLVGGAILIAIICFSNGKLMLSWIYNDQTIESVQTFQLLMFCFISMCIILIYGTLLTANGNLRFLNYLSLVGIAISVTLNGILIPVYGAVGSAIATLTTQTLLAFAHMLVAHQKFNINGSMKQGANYAGFIATLLLITAWMPSGNLKIPIQLMSGLLCMFVFKMIDVKKLKITFSSNL
jgi:O-antigen/teichoic acid export membrane protein